MLWQTVLWGSAAVHCELLRSWDAAKAAAPTSAASTPTAVLLILHHGSTLAMLECSRAEELACSPEHGHVNDLLCTMWVPNSRLLSTVPACAPCPADQSRPCTIQ